MTNSATDQLPVRSPRPRTLRRPIWRPPFCARPIPSQPHVPSPPSARRPLSPPPTYPRTYPFPNTCSLSAWSCDRILLRCHCFISIFFLRHHGRSCTWRRIRQRPYTRLIPLTPGLTMRHLVGERHRDSRRLWHCASHLSHSSRPEVKLRTNFNPPPPPSIRFPSDAVALFFSPAAAIGCAAWIVLVDSRTCLLFSFFFFFLWVSLLRALRIYVVFPFSFVSNSSPCLYLPCSPFARTSSRTPPQ